LGDGGSLGKNAFFIHLSQIGMGLCAHQIFFLEIGRQAPLAP
jgi:hypothetical protein